MQGGLRVTGRVAGYRGVAGYRAGCGLQGGLRVTGRVAGYTVGRGGVVVMMYGIELEVLRTCSNKFVLKSTL